MGAVLLAAPGAHARQATARLEGPVTDSMHARPLAGATVMVTRESPDPAAWFSVTTDDRGRYRLDSLLAGRYNVGLSHPILDSLELTLPPRRIEIGEGQHARLDLSLPSGAALREMNCPEVILPPGSGVLLGQVRDADADKSLAGAVVVVSWSDLAIDRATLKVSGAEHTVGAPTNVDGLYRFCGLPTDSWLAVQIQHAGRGGSVLRASIADTVGVAVLNVSFSTEAARAIAENDTAAGSESRPALLLSGSASVSGTVLGETGRRVLLQSCEDLRNPAEVRELGMAVFLDRPMGAFLNSASSALS